jgi:metallo-beta-lactamase class B
MRGMRFVACLLLLATSAFAQKDPVSRSWNQPVAPFRIAGNLYYIGASDITSFLITTPKGHIVLDGGFEETAPMIRDNIRTLGFRYEDVRILLSSHAHLDHAGGLALLKKETGAAFISSRGDVAQHARGGLDDPQFRDRYPYPPVHADRLVDDMDRVTLGGTTLVARITPGHTRGCTTWTMKVRDAKKTYDVAFLCSTTSPGYLLIGNPRYPDAVDDYRRQFAILESLSPDIFLASHGNFFHLQDKIKKRGGKTNPFVDPEGYREFVARSKKDFEEKVAKEKSAAATGSAGSF